MIVIHLARKPLSERSVATNTLKHETGALNIDGARLRTSEDTTRPSYGTALGTMNDDSWEAHNLSETGGHADGRWPANLTLEHLPGCRQAGTRKVKGAGWADRDSKGAGMGYHGAQGDGGRHYTGEDGLETTDAWECAPGCPVAALDGQTGTLTSTWRPDKGSGLGYSFASTDERGSAGYGDSGGASRFFKQVQQEPEVIRASGDVVCEACGHPYRDHPWDHHQLGYPPNCEPFLTVLCDGVRVKL